jgi:hypothetical protein
MQKQLSHPQQQFLQKRLLIPHYQLLQLLRLLRQLLLLLPPRLRLRHRRLLLPLRLHQLLYFV